MYVDVDDDDDEGDLDNFLIFSKACGKCHWISGPYFYFTQTDRSIVLLHFLQLFCTGEKLT
jgi:hypothetical protein